MPEYVALGLCNILRNVIGMLVAIKFIYFSLEK